MKISLEFLSQKSDLLLSVSWFFLDKPAMSMIKYVLTAVLSRFAHCAGIP